MEFIDLHCDTLKRLYELSNNGKYDETLWNNRGQIDVERLKKSGYTAQFFACFLHLGGEPAKDSLYEDTLAMADILYETIRKHPHDIALAGDYKEYVKNKCNGQISGFLTVEEGHILENKIERLDTLFEKGIRMITLTWNYENCLGYPNKDFAYQYMGLKPFGMEALAHMDELGIVADVSHLSDGGFEDVWRYGKRPFIATHSNARNVRGHSRNLTDVMLRKLADKGGIAGLNFYGNFLQENGQSTIDAVLKQMRYMMNIGGREVLCLGTDFDGMDGEQELNGCQEMPHLVRAMEHARFTTGEIEAICFANVEKFMERYWGK